ncbi:MAG: HAMP domain-containing histidine kinase [Candidatus Marinimicrobia bacterium]|nr:HAMP domain-containing histidine kinase [Candidatus Neomarinimicrobiota bacterium]
MPKRFLIPRESLRDKIFVFTAGLMVLVIGLTIILVNARFKREISSNLTNSLFQTARVLEHFREARFTALMDHAVELSHETRLKGSVATGDPETIHDILTDIQQIRKEDLILILSNEGELVSFWGPAAAASEAYRVEPSVQDAMNLFDSPDFWEVGGQLYETASVPITLGNHLVGILVLGNHIQRPYMSAFVPLSSAQFAIMKYDSVIATTLDSVAGETVTTQILQAIQNQTKNASHKTTDFTVPVLQQSDLFEFTLSQERYRGILVPIHGILGNNLGNFLIFKSEDRAYAQLVETRWLLILIGLGALSLAMVLNYFLSRSIMRPVETLVEHARHVGSGDLSQPVTVQGRDEIGVLAKAFEEMRVSLDKAQKELITNERLSLVGRMASAIIHDFKQPMSVISLSSQMMTVGEQTPEKLAEFHQVIDREINRMLGMINELLDFSRGEYRLNSQMVPLHRFIRESTEPLQHILNEAGITLNLALGNDVPVYIDRDRMRRILDNLIRNAIDAMAGLEEGRITIRTEDTSQSVTISITDTGNGIPEEIRDTIFEPFVTHGKSHGTGLGLAIARKIIAEHHGELTFETETGKGTTFYIRIPKP